MKRMPPKPVQIIKSILAQEKDHLVSMYHISDIGLFGSVVRGEQNSRSDVDILVDFSQRISAFHFIDLRDELSEKLGAKVDLVARQALKPRIGKRILSEVEYI